MEVNKKILDILKEFQIPKDDGLAYLICVYHGVSPSFIPPYITAKINATKIVVPSKTGLTWNLPLFKGVEVAFDWVKTEFVPLFKEVNPEKGGHVSDATKRMKKFFAENPSYRKEDVIEATKNYLFHTDAFYIRFPHYFIAKGRGAEKTSDLLDWLERLTDDRETYVPENQGTATRMQ